MKQIFADYSASISELKKNPSALIANSHGSVIAVLNHNTPTAYLVPAETFENIIKLLEDVELRDIVNKRLKDIDTAVEVDIETL
ncbi:antitoxin [candidate division KSB1 bacterium]|nr:MAG: antitoxin [candidate division KSB1 bacterium]